MTDTVVGKRLPFWRGMSGGLILFELISPLLFVGSIWWIVHLVRGYGHLFDDGHVAKTLFGTLFFAVALLVGLVGILQMLDYRRMVVLESPCPACGKSAVRSFKHEEESFQWPTECGVCSAYLRHDGVNVMEERLDACDTTAPFYRVPRTWYLPAAGTNTRNDLSFTMPEMCAICGAAEAVHRRDIGKWTSALSDFNALGVIGAVATDLADVSLSTKAPGTPGRGFPEKTRHEPTEEDRQGEALRGLRVAVCEKHTKERELGDPVEYNGGTLLFASYRYYRAFIDLNHIKKPPDVAT